MIFCDDKRDCAALASVSLTAELQHVDSLSEIGTKLGLVLVILSTPTKRSGTTPSTIFFTLPRESLPFLLVLSQHSG